MKKYNFFVLLGIILPLLIFVLVCLNLLIPLLDVYRIEVFVYTLLSAVALVLLVRGLFIKIDSSLFVSIFLIGVSIIGYMEVFALSTYSYMWPFYILALACANFIVRMVFFDRLQGFLGIISSGIFVFSLLFNLKLLGILWYIVFDIIWLVATVLTYNYIIHR